MTSPRPSGWLPRWRFRPQMPLREGAACAVSRSSGWAAVFPCYVYLPLRSRWPPQWSVQIAWMCCRTGAGRLSPLGWLEGARAAGGPSPPSSPTVSSSRLPSGGVGLLGAEREATPGFLWNSCFSSPRAEWTAEYASFGTWWLFNYCHLAVRLCCMPSAVPCAIDAFLWSHCCPSLGCMLRVDRGINLS